jgi:hypothetical protein
MDIGSKGCLTSASGPINCDDGPLTCFTEV